MFDASGMQSADFEEEDIDVFSELGVASYTISNSAKADDVLSALMDDDDEEIPEVSTEPISDHEEIPEVEPEPINNELSDEPITIDYSKFDNLDNRLKCGFVKQVVLKTLEDISGHKNDPIASSPEPLTLVPGSVNIDLEGNVAMLEITLSNENGELIKPVSVIDTTSGKPTPGSMSSKLPISYRPMARNLNKLLWNSFQETRDLISN